MFISENVEKVYGFTAEEIYKGGVDVWFGRIHPEDLQKVKKSYTHLFEKSENFDMEYRIKRKDGQWIWLRDRSVHFFEKQGMMYANGIFSDITKRKNVELELRKSEEKFKFLMTTSPAVIYTSKISGDFGAMFITDNVKSLTGYAPEEYLRDSDFWLNHIHPDDKDRVLSGLSGLISKGELQYEYRFKFKNGSYRWMLDECKIVKDQSDKPLEVIGYWIDITERKNAELALIDSDAKLKKLNDELERQVSERTTQLRISEEKYRNIVNNVLDIILEIDVNGKFLYVSPQVYNILGYTPEELINTSGYALIHPDDIEGIKDITLKSIATGKPIFYEYRIRHKNGRYVPMTASGNYIKIGNSEKIIGIVRDDTNKKESEQKLKESEEKYRNLLSNISDILIEVDLNRKISFVSAQCYEILGYKPEELIGKNSQDLIYTGEELLNKELILKALKMGEPLYNEHRVRHKLGHYVYLSMRGKVVKVGDSIKLIGIFRDSTEKVKIEAKLKKSEDKYRNAYDRELIYKDLFVHDFNNILQNIKSSADLTSLYLDTPLKVQTIKELNDIVSEQVFRGSKLIKNVRKLSQLEESKIQTSPFELNQLLSEVMDYIKQTFQNKVIKFEKTTPAPEIFVYANELLSDVFENIFINAVKYCDNLTCEILVNISKYVEKNKRYIKVEVIDNGVGIPDEVKNIIFLVGFSKEKRTKGMGFGLSVVKKIIERFNGRISVENRVKDDYSKGSKFILLLPEVI